MKGLATCVVLGLLVLGMVAWWWGNRPGEPVAAVPPGPAGVESAAVEDTGLRVGVSEESSPDTRREALPPVTSGEPAPLFGDAQTLPFTFTGRVVDATRRPVVGASLSLEGEAGPVAAGASGSGGHFELTAVLPLEPPPLLLVARDGAGNADRRRLFAPSSGVILLEREAAREDRRADAGTLVLRESHALEVRVGDGGRPAAEASVASELGHARLPGPWARADAEGRTLLEGLPRGVVHLEVRSANRVARGRAFVPEEDRIDLELVEAAAGLVQVVEADSARPIAGAKVVLRESVHHALRLPEEEGAFPLGEWHAVRVLAEALSDADGEVRFEGLHPDRTPRVLVEAQGYAPNPPPRGGTSIVFAPGPEPLRIELAPQPRCQVRWPLADGELPAPADGTPIEFGPLPGAMPDLSGRRTPEPFSGQVRAQELVAEVDGHTGVWMARAPDGALARVAVPNGEVGREVAFQRPRRLTVRLTERDGSPAVGVTVSPTDQGFRPMAPTIRTDEAGRAVFEGLEADLASVRADRGGDAYGPVVGHVDLARGDGLLEASVPGIARAEFLVRIEGRPGLPPTWRLQATGEGRRVTVLAEDPEEGRLEAEIEGLDPGEAVALQLRATGFLTARVDARAPPAGGPLVASFELQPHGVLTVDVAGERPEGVRVVPQRWDEAGEAWQVPASHGFGQGASLPNGPGGRFVLGGLEPGRWRAVDLLSQTPSGEVELSPGRMHGQVRIDLVTDLVATAFATGSVELPDEGELARTRILVRGGEEEAPRGTHLPGRTPPRGVWPRDGQFRIAVPQDTEVELVPWHPWLVPAADGSARVRGDAEGLVLRLVEGNVLTLDLSSHPELARVSALRIARFAPGVSDPPTAEPLEWHHAPVVDGSARCHLPAGTWDLAIDPGHHFRPLFLRGVKVSGSLTRAPHFELGASIHLRVLVPPGQDAPRIYLSATHRGALQYQRELNSGGETVVELPGLGPGPFRLRYGPIADLSPLRSLDVDLDGENPIEIDLELR